MLKSMFSGVSGLKANQQKLDVIGNNIANVSTTGFKGSSVNFQDMLSQSVIDVQGSSPINGGINGSQIGVGVRVGSIAVNQSQGSLTPSGSSTDLAIDGEGYFIVAKGTRITDATSITVDPTSGSATSHSITANTVANQISYTRDGSFSRDNNGNLVNTNGLRVLGYAVTGFLADKVTASAGPSIIQDPLDPNKSASNFVSPNAVVTADGTNLMSLVIPDEVISGDGTTRLKVTKVTVDQTGLIIATLKDGTQSALGQIAMATFQNTKGLKDIGGNLNQVTANSGSAIIKSALGGDIVNDNSQGYGTTNSGYLEASNVDLAQEFTDMIVTTKAFQANGKVISNGDELLQAIIGLKR